MKKVLIFSIALFGLLALLSLVIYLLLPAALQTAFVYLMAMLLVVILVIVIVVDMIFLLPTINGAIYLPSSNKQIQAMLELAAIKPGEKAVDVGSGDGRIVRKLAQAGADAHGCEINPILVFFSWWQSRHLPPRKRGTFHWANLWYVDFSSYDVVIIFGMTYIMKGLEAKLKKELKPGARVVCNSFPFPHWPYDSKRESVYLYTVK